MRLRGGESGKGTDNRDAGRRRDPRDGVQLRLDGTEAFETNNNRLLEYNEYVDEELTRTVSYVYYKTGHASNVTIKDAGDEVYRGLALYYTRTGRLWLAIWEQWELDEYEEVTSYAPTAAREFMYDSGRARYLARDVDPETFEPEGAQRWSDYDGDEPYGDFAVTIGQQGAAVIDESMRYLNGGGTLAQQTVVEGQGDELDYLHGDLIRSTVATTDADGQNGAYSGPPVTVAYTAFGEIVHNDGSDNITIGSAAPAGFPRYQYAGGFGYETGSADASSTGGMLTLNGAEGTAPIRLMHVGERWYQPNVGRFIMRDPIGWQGGLNTYGYVGNRSSSVTDPSGLGFFKFIWTGDWNASDEQYDAALDGAVEALNSPPPASSRAIAAAGGAALAGAAKLAKADKLLDKAVYCYGLGRLGASPTGYPLIDGCLDAFAAGAGTTSVLTKGAPPKGGEIGGAPGSPLNPPYLRKVY